MYLIVKFVLREEEDIDRSKLWLRFRDGNGRIWIVCLARYSRLDMSDQRPSRAHISNFSLRNLTINVALSCKRAITVDHLNLMTITRQTCDLETAREQNFFTTHHHPSPPITCPILAQS